MTIQNNLIRDYHVAKPFEGINRYRDTLLAGEAVVVKDDNDFIGVLSLKDIITKPHNLVIDSLCTKPSVQPADSSLTTLILMCHENYEYLPVKDGDAFVGLVSRQQLLLKALSHQSPETTLSRMTELQQELSLKNRFLTMIGHDIKNLFNQVVGSMELLDKKFDRLDQNKVQTLLRLAKGSAEQVNSAFEGILLWARLSTGQLKFNPREVPLQEYLDQMVGQFQLAGNVKNITIRNCFTSSYSVYADTNMLGCILSNLVYNAIKFTPSGGEIWLEAEKRGSIVTIAVADNGLGMSADQQEHLFRYGQSRQGTSGEVGAGIGLIICKEFVDRHGGSINIESEPGKGTKVLVSLPDWDEKALT